MRDILDIHTHTIMSGHAYSTIREQAMMASEKGLEILGITEHGPKLLGAPSWVYFSNLKVVDRFGYYGVELLLGSELNILNEKGEVDLPERILKQMDVTIASLHTIVTEPRSKEYHTQAYIEAMKNPYVNIIGHPDDVRYPVDYLALVQAAKEYDVLLELNNSSLKPGGSRGDTRASDIEMLKYCKEYGTSIIVDSDAHVDLDVGKHDIAMKLLEELQFPEELVVNTSGNKLKKYVNKYK